MGILYIVPTPLGNLEDITLRALRVLKSVALIATEDTRTTGKLLNHFEISCPTLSYFEHSPPAQLERVLGALAEGDVALVSEAGTPLLSDPGYRLVQAAAERGFTVTPLPGPSAITTALSASGLPTDRFLFAGFLPRKAGQRRQLLQDLQAEPSTLVFFEAPHRLLASLADMAQVFGPDRGLAVCRELTKLHEEIWRGSVAGALAEWQTREPRGEFTLVVAGAEPPGEWPAERVVAALAEALAGGSSVKDAARQVAQQSGWPKRKVYDMARDF
ncbi:MAG: Ribosomal RNA small subunit methyltransferase I [Anaerolineae bacterium]|nr:Ribosomal RNA small subunit methyltransferase I [Anaerolineae bacterium]